MAALNGSCVLQLLFQSRFSIMIPDHFYIGKAAEHGKTGGRQDMWYKGNLHCHTTDSDGKHSPWEVVRMYREAGYSFLAITDHNRYSDYQEQYGSSDFLILPGVEAAAIWEDEDGTALQTHHMNGILGTEEMCRNAKALYAHGDRIGPFICRGTWDAKQAAQEMAALLKSHGMLVTYNHPIWSRISMESFCDIRELDILEIFNYGTWQEDETGYDTTYWDAMLRSGRRILADASDDSHRMTWDAFGGYIMVEADSLDRESIIEAIRRGRYYSSAGPEILSWGVEDGVARLVCSPCERATLIYDGWVGAGYTKLASKESGAQPAVTEISVRLTGKERYIRAECRDFEGRRAWTNPIYLKHEQNR